MPVTLSDVAAKANVSVSTVSRVINNKDRVDKETRKKVMEAVDKLQYYPNDIARNLRGKSAKTIAVVVPDLSNYFYASVIKGIESVSQQNGYSVLVCNSNEDCETEARHTQILLQKQISGLVIATVSGSIDFYQQYLNRNIPVVFFDNCPKTEQSFDFVSVDNVKASYDLVEHLIHIGHRDIAILTGSQTESSASERLLGWKKALEQNDIPIVEEQIGIGEFNIKSGIKMMKKILSLDRLPTAVFAANNFLAYGAIHAILESNLRIPEDIAVACFDAIDHTGLIKPQITTSIQPSEEIGTISAELLINKIKNVKKSIYHKIMLESNLLIKESTVKK